MKYATITVSLVILIAVLIPGPDLPDIHLGGYDKLIHMGMFLVWGLAVRYDFGPGSSIRLYQFLIAGVVFSFLTEILQILIEGRSFDIYDMLADLVGLILGLLLGGPLARRLKRTE